MKNISKGLNGLRPSKRTGSTKYPEHFGSTRIGGLITGDINGFPVGESGPMGVRSAASLGFECSCAAKSDGLTKCEGG